jgi:hypothetical protein
MKQLLRANAPRGSASARRGSEPVGRRELTLRNQWMLRWMGGLIAIVAVAQIRDLHVTATATQAVIRYTAPDTAPCQVAVREGSAPAPLVADVDPALFSGAQWDTRPGTVRQGLSRIFIAGKRSAETAANGQRYSRALQAFTDHSFEIQCGSASASGTFRTANLPLGHTYSDPPPGDPNLAGDYAWPAIDFADRTRTYIDPLTGLQLRRITSPRDYWEDSVSVEVLRALSPDGAWSNVSAVMADDAASATFSGTGQNWLFLESGLTDAYLATHNNAGVALNLVWVDLNAWCSSADCATASAEDRSLELCLSVDGVNCATFFRLAELQPCTSNCGGAPYRLTLGDTTPPLRYWTPRPPFDSTAIVRRTGGVSRNGAEVTWQWGDLFGLQWGPGSRISIDGTSYTIQKVNHERSLTLAGNPTGTSTGVAYEAANFGVLIRKRTASTHQMTVQFARVRSEIAAPAAWNAGGDNDTYTNCAYAKVAGPEGELGWHCVFGRGLEGALYWIGSTTGRVTMIGSLRLPVRPGVDGWDGLRAVDGLTWDTVDPNSWYAVVNNGQGKFVVVKATYNGSNQDISPKPWYEDLQTCGTPPCWTFTNLTPVSTNQTILDQIAVFHPDWAASRFAAPFVSSLGRLGDRNALLLQIRRDAASNDLLSFHAVFDLSTARLTAAAPSWKTAPMRWGSIHGTLDIGYSDWAAIGVTYFRGPWSGPDPWIGNGPYASTIVSGTVGTGGEPCPSRPNDSPVAAAHWPAGNNCLVVTVDGEPGDPTPAQYTTGTISAQGDSVVGTGVLWQPWWNGAQVQIGSSYHRFTWVSSTEGRLDPPVTMPISNSPYTLHLENVNHPKVGNPAWAYLQDAAPGDLFCATTTPENWGHTNGCGLFSQTEYFRLLTRNGNTWTLERGWAGEGEARQPFRSVAAGAKLVTIPNSCYFESPFPCAMTTVYWNFLRDPLGQNLLPGSQLLDRRTKALGHSLMRPGLQVGTSPLCVNLDGLTNGCYGVRTGSIPGIFESPSYFGSSNPVFAGLVGLGEGNGVDTHPSYPQTAQAAAKEQTWFLDARPFLGNDTSTGSAGQPAVAVSGDLWKLTANQVRLRRKVLPTAAFCGVHPLRDVSGPGSILSGANADRYRYCVANQAGECQPNSTAGDVFVNCPQLSTPYCTYPGIGGLSADRRDLCINDHAVHNQGVTQVGVSRPDTTGRNSRLLTHAFGRHRWNDQFWNVKGTPDGKWWFIRTPWLDGQFGTVLLAKGLPWPETDSETRADFRPIPVQISRPSDARVTNVVVEYGYTPEFYCTSRQEPCWKGTGAGVTFASESPAGVSCPSGCQVDIPSLAQRVLYYRVRYRDAANQTLALGVTRAVAVP